MLHIYIYIYIYHIYIYMMSCDYWYTHRIHGNGIFAYMNGCLFNVNEQVNIQSSHGYDGISHQIWISSLLPTVALL